MITDKNWSQQTVLVTGACGFLGSHVVEELKRKGCERVIAVRRSEHDLRKLEDVRRLFVGARPTIVLHLAANVGGIGANRRYPADFFYDNALMGLHVIEQARQYGVEKLVCVGTVCSYPKWAPAPFAENELWNGYPEETNAPYGIAKKMLLVQLQAYRQQYGFDGIYLIPANLYGPRDSFNPERSHVIPALIHKCVQAKRSGQPFITLWGTGRATREFLYVQDAARAIVLAAERYHEAAPMNLGSAPEISIRELAELIRQLVGYEGAVHWDASQPDGQMRRSVDASQAHERLGWLPEVPLREGLSRTIDWYLQQSVPEETAV